MRERREEGRKRGRDELRMTEEEKGEMDREKRECEGEKGRKAARVCGSGRRRRRARWQHINGL